MMIQDLGGLLKMCNPFYDDGTLKKYENLCVTHKAEYFGSDGLEGKVGGSEGIHKNNKGVY
jgi:hypothetical protein